MPTTDEKIQQLRAIADNKPEPRSKRVQLLITPTMYEALKALAKDSDVSVNEIINVALTEYMIGK